MATNENMIGVRADFIMQDFDRHVQQYNERLNQANKATEDFYKKQSTSIADVASAFAKGSAAIIASVTAIAVTMKQVFEFGKQGAIINQINASFQQLIGTEAQAAAMERRLSDAVRGTMTGEQLRVSIIKLLTGAEGAFADRVKEAAPALFEMAAAANKLNPTLGGTSAILEAMTQSLEMGTTRSLKRLGIIIDQTKAEDDYARSIGKTKDELTEEERKVAVLNAALEYHDTLLRQVGGDVGSEVDSFTRLEVAIDETADKLKTALAPALADAAEAMALLLTWNDKLNATINKHDDDVLKTSKTYQEYATEVLRATNAGKGLGYLDAELSAHVSMLAEGNEKLAKQWGILTPAEYENARAIEAATAAIANYNNKAASMLAITAGMALTGKDLAEAQKAVIKAQEERQKGIADYSNKITDLTIKSGEDILSAEKDLQDKSISAWQDYIRKTEDIVGEGIQARAKIQQAYGDKIAGAERDYQRGVEDANYQHGQKMADIERDYQQTIREIQQTYQEDALDAIRNLDAIGLLRAKEKRDKDLANAGQNRNQQIQAEQDSYNRSLYELSRALADKREEAERDRRRDLAEQQQNERDKLNEAKRAYNDQTAAAQQAFNDKLAAINQSYTNEDIAARAHYLNQQNLLTAHLQAMQAIMSQYGIGVPAVKAPSGGGHRRASGGVDIVSSPTQFTAGEAGPEMAMFVPLNRTLPTPSAQVVTHTGDFSHSIDAAISSSVAGLDGRIVAAVRKAIGEILQ